MTATAKTTARKKNLYFTVEFRRCLDLFIISASIGLRTFPSLLCDASVQFKLTITKIFCRRSRSPKYPEPDQVVNSNLERTAMKL